MDILWALLPIGFLILEFLGIKRYDGLHPLTYWIRRAAGAGKDKPLLANPIQERFLGIGVGAFVVWFCLHIWAGVP